MYVYIIYIYIIYYREREKVRENTQGFVLPPQLYGGMHYDGNSWAERGVASHLVSVARPGDCHNRAGMPP